MKQQRNTRQRQLILKTVQARNDHPSADQIYLDVRMLDEKISRGTVYRNLKLLAKQGDITHVRIPGLDRFDCRKDKHYHFLCTDCGAVSDLPVSYHEEWDEKLTKQTGCVVNRHRVVFEGICAKCRSKNSL